MSPGYGVRDVTDWEVVNPEPVGREEKVWLRPPGVGGDGSKEQDWLFKPVVVASNGHRQGEDWSEKIACELAKLIRVPCAEVELAVRHGVEGSISRNVAPDGWSLVHGAILLGATVDGYVDGAQNRPGRPGHSLGNIMSALAGCAAPAPSDGCPDACSAFAGYLVLDAWIGNPDRHDQNWAVLRRSVPPGTLRLAASYDHASGLAFQRLDSFRSARLRNGDVADFAEGARGRRFEHAPSTPRSLLPTLVEIADHGLGLAGADARRYWMDRLGDVAGGDVEVIVSAIPELSEVTRSFILELVGINRRRLLHACR